MGLKLENVSKKFVGKQAVDNISFEVNKPGVFGSVSYTHLDVYKRQ